MKSVMPFFVSKNRSAFIPGISTGDNVLLSQSLCKDYHLHRGGPPFACKVDLRKGFDMLNWNFVFNTLRNMHFSDKFFGWIRNCVTTCTISVKINGSFKDYLESKSGLRQSEPISPYLFVLAMEVLTACLKATSSSALAYHWRAKELKLTHLIFADDLMIFCKGTASSIEVLMRGITVFSKCSGLSSNPGKSMCFFGNVTNAVVEYALNLTGYDRGTLPVNTLVIPLFLENLQ